MEYIGHNRLPANDETQTIPIANRPLTKWRLTAFLLIGLIVLAAASFGGYKLYERYIKPDTNKGRTYVVDYKNLEIYKLGSRQAGTAISFDKPPEFKKVDESIQPNYSWVSLVDYNEALPLGAGLGYIKADIIHNTLAATPSYRQQLNKYLNEPNGQQYQQFSATLRNYVINSLPGQPEVDTVEIAPFTNSHINGDAWQMNFHSVPGDDRSIVLQGKLIFLIGKKSFYYLQISTIGYNWLPNQAIWQRMLDSLKIDQD